MCDDDDEFVVGYDLVRWMLLGKQSCVLLRGQDFAPCYVKMLLLCRRPSAHFGVGDVYAMYVVYGTIIRTE